MSVFSPVELDISPHPQGYNGHILHCRPLLTSLIIRFFDSCFFFPIVAACQGENALKGHIRSLEMGVSISKLSILDRDSWDGWKKVIFISSTGNDFFTLWSVRKYILPTEMALTGFWGERKRKIVC